MVRLVDFQETLEMSKEQKRHLLLGNGFRMALFPDIFAYQRLLDAADFSSIQESEKVFQALGTTDFEEVVQALRTTAKVLPAFLDDKDLVEKMLLQAFAIKELLVEVIAVNHPENPGSISESQFSSCRKFLAHFISVKLASKLRGNIYTVNYDLLLYWVLMHDNEKEEGVEKLILHADDGFRAPEDQLDAGYVTWGGLTDGQNIRFIHGGLHLFDDGYDLMKFCWERSGGIPLIEQIRTAITSNRFPLFVSEGNSTDKLKKIRHSHISLQSALKSLSKISGNMFVYGHSFADNDDHILNLIPKSKVKRLFVAVYGGLDNNKLLRDKALALAEKRTKGDLEVIFFDSESAKVWNLIE